MIAGFSASLSGLMAQTKRLAVSADNVANWRSRGRDPEGPVEQPGTFVPKQVQDVTVAGGGVRAQVRPVDPPSVAVYAPYSPGADAAPTRPTPRLCARRTRSPTACSTSSRKRGAASA
jgi:flagellar basal body rod protein FlgC